MYMLFFCFYTYRVNDKTLERRTVKTNHFVSQSASILSFAVSVCNFRLGEKPYPCTYCGRRFRTNYNKLGHEKKCPDRHARAILSSSSCDTDSPGVVPSVAYR